MKEKIKFTPEWLVILIEEVIELLKKEGRQAILRYTRKIELKEIECDKCGEKNPVIKVQEGNKCVFCKNIVKEEDKLF